MSEDQAPDDPPGGKGSANGKGVVLVTGGARGIGLACARRFVSRGHQVAITYNQTEPPDSGMLAIQCDVRSQKQVDVAFETVEAELGNVDVVVANAGIVRDSLMLRMTEDAWTDVMDTDLTGVYRVVRRSLGPMVRAHRGRIISFRPSLRSLDPRVR